MSLVVHEIFGFPVILRNEGYIYRFALLPGKVREQMLSTYP
jgi:hypothetical protein